MLDGLHLVLGKAECPGHKRIAFDKLAGGKAYGDTSALGMILDEMHNAMQAAMNSSAMIGHIAKVLTGRRFLVVSHMNSMTYELIDTLVLHSADRNDRDAQQLFHLVDADGTAVTLHFIHHIEGQNHRDAQLHELHRQVEVALDIGSIHDIDDT